MYQRISIDSKVCHGQACIKGTRIPVHQIVHMLANGDTIAELLEEYPSLEQADIFSRSQIPFGNAFRNAPRCQSKMITINYCVW